MAKFKKGESVKVVYVTGNIYRDEKLLRHGKVVGLVQKWKWPNPARFKFKRKPSGGVRDHLSYIVQDQHTGYCYWPLVKYIERA